MPYWIATKFQMPDVCAPKVIECTTELLRLSVAKNANSPFSLIDSDSIVVSHAKERASIVMDINPTVKLSGSASNDKEVPKAIVSIWRP